MLHITIAGDKIFEIGGFVVTNTLITSVLANVVLLICTFWYGRQLKSKQRGLIFYLFHSVLTSIYNLFREVLGDKVEKFFPFVGALFFYILFQNWFGLIPGAGSITVGEHGHVVPLLRGGNTDINLPLTLAVITVFFIQYQGIVSLGFRKYFGKFFNFSGFLPFVVGLLELLSEVSRILSFTFRLFGNVLAGKILLAVAVFFTAGILIPFPFFIIEIFAGIIQALVFAMLAAIFLNLATEEHQ